MNERMRFVVRLEKGESMTDLCSEFGISRKTGYKIWNRYKSDGPAGLFDQTRRPKNSPQKTPHHIRNLIVQARRKHPTWGPRKLRVWLMRKHPQVAFPSQSTFYQVIKAEGLIKKRVRKRRATPSTLPLIHANAPNTLWCADFKGQFKLGNGVYCYPLTITDAHSRYLLACEGLENTRTDPAIEVFRQTFVHHGLPERIRTDNGVPFAATGLAGWSRLSAWWRRLGITHERIEPGHPEQNGRHERMHLTLKQMTTRPPGSNLLQQQERFDSFQVLFNEERPHEALDDACPVSVYQTSSRPFPRALPPLSYPLHDLTLTVHSSGGVRFPQRVLQGLTVHISSALVGQTVGVRELDSGNWLVSFVDQDLGEINPVERCIQPSS